MITALNKAIRCFIAKYFFFYIYRDRDGDGGGVGGGWGGGVFKTNGAYNL